MATVAGGLQYAHQHVVHYQTGGAGKIDAQIFAGFDKYFLRCAHPTEHRRGDGHADQRDQHTEDQPHGHRGVHGQSGLTGIVRADVVGDHHARAGGEAHEEADEQVDERRVGAHSRKGVFTQVISDDQGVRGVVELLEQIADEDGDCKPDDLPAYAALGQYTVHMCLRYDASFVAID